MDSIETYDVKNDIWNTQNKAKNLEEMKMPEPRNSFGAVNLYNKVYIIGGKVSKTQKTDSMVEVDIAT